MESLPVAVMHPFHEEGRQACCDQLHVCLVLWFYLFKSRRQLLESDWSGSLKPKRMKQGEHMHLPQGKRTTLMW